MEEKETLPKPQTVKNELGYIWWVAMPQQNAQILFMEMDSGTDQWADELLKYTRPSPALQTALPVRPLQADLKMQIHCVCVGGGG